VTLAGHRELHAADRAQMLYLTALTFPAVFRARTAELGHYYGILNGAQLVAMAGERMAFANQQEMSGVCTHPGFAKLGYARQLKLALLQRQQAR
jgi:hypothetical protein